MGNVIAIDGPAGAGKSTLAKRLAKKLGYKYLDTGAMYRAITWLALQKGINIHNKEKLAQLAQKAKIDFLPAQEDGGCPIYVNGSEVTDEIRKPIVDKNVSQVAKVKEVRQAMVKSQQEIARNGDIIMDGRDIGTRVLPDADYKFFVTASLEERARRRYNEIKDKHKKTLEEIKRDIARRDKIDKERKESPLVKAEDAILIDTTNLNENEVLKKVLEFIREGD